MIMIENYFFDLETLKTSHLFIGRCVEKNGHILATGQWYAPSAVIKHALYFMVLRGLHGIAWYCMVLHCIAWYCMVLYGIA